MEAKHDQIIRCQDCGQDFVWTEGEQEFYQEKGLAAPTRCAVCRAVFKAAQQDKFRGKVQNEVWIMKYEVWSKGLKGKLLISVP